MPKKMFCFILLLIYIGYLAKDNLIYLFQKFDNTTYEVTKSSYYEQEYNKLTNILELTNYSYDLIYARSIRRDIYDFYDQIIIDKGQNQGLKTNSIVLNNQGVIGVIKKVNNNSSEVSLLTSPSIQLSVKINEAYGILTSQDNKIIVKNIKSKENINIGDKVYTSGLTNIKEGLYIGEVLNIQKDNLDLEYILEIKPIVDFYNLNYVGVII